jgi:hypothetical protein
VGRGTGAAARGKDSDSENRPADRLGYVGSGESCGKIEPGGRLSLNPRNHEENVALLAFGKVGGNWAGIVGVGIVVM